MSVSIGLSLALGAQLPSSPVQTASVQITGLTESRAMPESHNTVGAVMSDGSVIDSYAWGSVADGSQYGAGANPTDYSANPGGALYLTVTAAGQVFRTVAIIGHIAPVLVGQVPDQDLTVDMAITPLDLSAYVTGAPLSYAVLSGGLPAGLSLTGSVISGAAADVQGATDVGIAVSNEAGTVIVILRFSVSSGGLAPVLSEVIALDDARDLWGVRFDQTGGTLVWARLADGSTAPAPDGVGGWLDPVLESGSVSYTGGALEIPETGTTGVAYKVAVYHYNNGQSSNVLMAGYTADNTAPTVSFSDISTEDSAAQIVVSTNEDNGHYFHLVNLASESVPDAAAVKTGAGHVVTSSGDQISLHVTGLTNGTEYRISVVHRDAHRNDSAVVSALFTPVSGASNIATPIIGGFRIDDVSSVPGVTTTAIAGGFLIEDE